MEGINIWAELLKLGPVFIVMGAIIYWLLGHIKELKGEKLVLTDEIKKTNQDYREISVTSLKTLVLVEDKLGELRITNESVSEIHRMVKRIQEIEEDREREAKGKGK